MPKRTLTLINMLLLTVGMLLSMFACGGDGSDGEKDARTSTVQGRVAQNTAALQPTLPQRSQLARLWDVLLGPRLVYAQADPRIVGIRVTAGQNGTTVDTTTTDATGSFTLRVTPGNVTLVFETERFSLPIEVIVPDDGTLLLVVTLKPTQVVIDEGEIKGTLRCTNRTIEFTETTDLIIDGGGNACIRAEGNCSVHLTAPNIFLQNCESCVRAEGNASVSLTAETTTIDGVVTGGTIECEAAEQGIRAEGTADIDLQAEDEIVIDAGEQGIRAGGTSLVQLGAPHCIVHGDEQGIRRDGAAEIDTTDCEVLEVTR